MVRAVNSSKSSRRHDDRFVRWQRQVIDLFSGYFWLVFKNVIGWILILSSPVVAAVFPGPGGVPAFIIGFALVSFPGKRRLTSRVMRGRGLPIEMEVFTFLSAFLAILITCIVMYFVSDAVDHLLQRINLDPSQDGSTYTAVFAGLVITGLFALGVTWLVMRLALKVLNFVLRGMPMVRRRLRPWLRKRGLNILPTRRKRDPFAENGKTLVSGEDEILEIHPRHQHRARVVGMWLLLWGKRALALAITIGIFYWILRPIRQRWPDVKEPILNTSITRFGLAAGMFAVFLLVFRALVWRYILASFGHKLPVAAATRIWSTSEFARYLPGAIWQVVGRVYLVHPYGVTKSVCSITQVLELAIFLLANILVALSCLLYFGIKSFDDPWVRTSLYTACALAPVLLLLLHTRIFYGIINRVMSRMGKPPIVRRLRGYQLVGLLFWNMFGLLWQSLAIFIIVQTPLHLKWDWWWVVAGAYCLAWCAGFLAFWAPGGIGVREVVFVGAMKLILPHDVQASASLPAMLAFLSVLLRLWATAGEFILATIAYALDLRGAMGRPDAPGRVETALTPIPGAQGSA